MQLLLLLVGRPAKLWILVKVSRLLIDPDRALFLDVILEIGLLSPRLALTSLPLQIDIDKRQRITRDLLLLVLEDLDEPRRRLDVRLLHQELRELVNIRIVY